MVSCSRLDLSGTGSNAVDVTVEEHTGALTLGSLGGLDELAHTGTVPHGLEETSPAGVGLSAVVLAHDSLDGIAGLVGVVEGDVADIVVQDVSLDDAVEDVAADETKVTVDGGSSATGEVPDLGLVVRKSGVGVLQEGDGNQPVVHPQVRDTVPDEQVEPAELGADGVQEGTSEEETQVTQGNQLGVLGLVQGAGGVEVVDTAEPSVGLALAAALGLLGVVVVASNVGDQVHGPAEQLLEEQVGGSQDGGVLHELTDLVDGGTNAACELVTGLGDEDHVAGNVTGGLVVLAVRDLPGEVRNQQQRVTDPTNSVVQDLGGREGLVTTLVSQNPDTGSNHTLDNSVQGPQGDASGHERNGLGSDIVVEEVKDGAQNGKVTENIVQAGDGGPVEAVRGDGIANLLDGEIRDLELVAVGVNHLGVLLDIHGGQGSGRGGLARAVQGRSSLRAGDRRLGGGVAAKRIALGEGSGGHGEGLRGRDSTFRFLLFLLS